MRLLIGVMCFCIGLTGLVFLPALGSREQNRPLWLRNTALSPQGDRLVFTYRGDLYTVPTEGGTATLLAGNLGYISNVYWSPKGDLIAVSITGVDDNSDVYTIPVNGGDLTRLTWHPANEYPLGFTPDGNNILINTPQLSSPKYSHFSVSPVDALVNQVYEIPVGGGRMTPVLPFPIIDADVARDGMIAFAGPFNLEQLYRKHQKSMTPTSIWTYNPGTGDFLQVTPSRISAFDPLWGSSRDSLFYLSERSGDLNIWMANLSTDKHVQVTTHTDHPVRDLSMSMFGDLAYSYMGELYYIKNGESESKKVDVSIPTSHPPFIYQESHTATIPDFVVNPVEAEAVVSAFGDLYVVDLNTGQSRELVKTPYEERSMQYLPDGSGLVYAVESDGYWGIFLVTPEDDHTFMTSETNTIEPMIHGEFDAQNPLISPEGKEIAYLRDRSAIHVYDCETGIDREIMPAGINYSYSDNDIVFEWSPDSNYIAVEQQSSIIFSNIFIYPVNDLSEPVQITFTGSSEELYVWTPDSLIYLSSAESPYLADGSQEESHINRTFLSRQGSDADKNEEETGTPEMPELPNYEILKNTDFEALTEQITTNSERIHFVASVQEGQSVFYITDKVYNDGSMTVIGHLIHLESGVNEQVMEIPYANLAYAVSSDTLYVHGGTDSIRSLDLNTGEINEVPYSININVNLQDYVKASYDQFRTLVDRKLFDPNHNGVDWEYYGNYYRQFLDYVDDFQDVTLILQELAGELNVSHTSASYTDPLAPSPNVGFLGLVYNHQYEGPGLEIGEVVTNGPFDRTDSQVRQGDVLLAVNGKTIDERGGLYRVLTGLEYSDIIVRVARDGKEWTESVTSIDYSDFKQLLHQRWIKQNRQKVIDQSDGKIGYVYIGAMDESEYRKLVSDALGWHRDTEGLIVDTRFNVGGLVHDQLITFLTGTKYQQATPREPGSKVTYDTMNRWYAPSLVLVNTSNYSDASVFPQAYQELGIGDIVGSPVSGTGTAVWDVESNIIPGLSFGFPELPFRKMDGTYYENLEITPDVPVDNSPGDLLEGVDNQLDVAIQVMLETIQ